MSNNANGNKRVIFSGIVCYCGDNDFIIQIFDFIAHSDAVRVTCTTDADSRVTCST